MGKTAFAAAGQTRRETINFWVLVTPEERDIIMVAASRCGLSVSAYFRNLALAYSPTSAVDVEQVRNLLAVNADMGRLGGLLKMWLNDRERYNDTQMMSVNRLLERLDETQIRLSGVVDEVLKRARRARYDSQAHTDE